MFINLDKFQMAHPWILNDPQSMADLYRPPRRFASEECARRSQAISGGSVRRDSKVPENVAVFLSLRDEDETYG